MVKVGGVLVCLLIIALDVAAGIFGFQAEVAQNKVKHLRLWIFECRDPSHDAFKLGLAAAGLLALAHVIANLLGGCMCICSQDELSKASPNRQLSLACLVFSWIILAVGMSMLVIGTLSNNKSRASCGLTHHHFLSIGGILCFVHGLFCVAYYVSASAASHEEGKFCKVQTAASAVGCGWMWSEKLNKRKSDGGMTGDVCYRICNIDRSI